MEEFDFLKEYSEDEKQERRKLVLKYLSDNCIIGAYYNALYDMTYPPKPTKKQEVMDKITELKEFKVNIDNSIKYLKNLLITNT